MHGNANVAYLNKSYFTFICKISDLRERVSARGGGGGGGGGNLIFSSYVDSGPASTIQPKKYQAFQAPSKNI